MSELLSAAAQRMGIPEALVGRSAEARAKATGASVDEVLQAWAGGEAAPAAAPPAEPEEAPAEAPPEPEAEEVPVTPAPEVEAPPAPPPATAPQPAAAAAAVAAGPPPILEGRHERPFGVMLGAVGLLLLSMLVGFAVPAIPEPGTGVYTSTIDFSGLAREGRRIYLSEGCAACHTQAVRAMVADAGLGGVTLSDTNQVIGNRRFGPDLAHIGSRVESDADIIAILEGAGAHPAYAQLSQDQLRALIAYLLESR